MKVALGTFARHGIEVWVGPDIDRTVELALRSYAGGLRTGSNPAPPAFPSWLLATAPEDVGSALELPVDVETEMLLTSAAEELGTDASRLAGHVVMAYLAEFDRLKPFSRPV